MNSSRRGFITAAAAVGLAGLGAATPARAAGFDQEVLSPDIASLSGLIEPQEGDDNITALDLQVGAPKVNAVVTYMDEPRAMAAFGMKAPLLSEVVAAGLKDDIRLRGLCAQTRDSYMALFELDGAPAPERWHLRQTAAEYQAMVTAAARAGEAPVSVSVDNLDPEPRFTTLVRRSTGAWEARHHLKVGDLTPLTLAMKDKGLRLARSVPYLLGGELRFCNLYRPAGRHGWQAWNLEQAEFQARCRQYAEEGYALLQAISFPSAGKTFWSGVWQRAVGAPQDLFWGV